MAKKKSVRPTRQTPESTAFREAIERSGKTQQVIADVVNLTPGFISQVATGRSPLPAKYAKALADYLDTKPELISAEFASGLVTFSAAVVGGGAVESADARRPDMALRRLENDVTSLRYAVAVLASTMVVNRPREAKEAAASLRKKVAKKFLERGFLFELLKTLDAAGS